MRRTITTGLVVMLITFFSTGTVASSAGPPSIIINIAAQTLSYYAGDTLVKEYPIAIGKPETPSPLGEFEITEKIVNPWWFPTEPGMNPVPPGPGNPLGYRWIGFNSVYGVHGTNMPWSIGTAASKGCIRMYEKDVEELFPLVSIGTPVQVKYDTISVVKDKQGVIYTTLYDDIYGYGTTTVTRFKEKLAGVGAEDMLSYNGVVKLLQTEKGKLQRVGQMLQVKFNDKLAAQTGILVNDIVLIPSTAIIQNLGLSLDLNYVTGSVSWQGRTVSGELHKNDLYVKLWDLCELFGVECAFDSTTATASVEMLQITYNGKPLPVRVQKINGIIALPLQPLLAVTGINAVTQTVDKKVILAGRELPAIFSGDEPHIQITRLQEALNIHVYYDTDNRMIYLTYVASGP